MKLLPWWWYIVGLCRQRCAVGCTRYRCGRARLVTWLNGAGGLFRLFARASHRNLSYFIYGERGVFRFFQLSYNTSWCSLYSPPSFMMVLMLYLLFVVRGKSSCNDPILHLYSVVFSRFNNTCKPFASRMAIWLISCVRLKSFSAQRQRTVAVGFPIWF